MKSDMDEKRIADYFIVAGLPPDPQPLDEYCDEASIKPSHRQDPVVDITVINRTLGEVPPQGFHCVEFTPNGFPADLNHGSLRAHEMNVCFRRGRDKPPLTDIGVLLDNKEGVKPGCEMVLTTPQGHSANVNNSSNVRIFITYRRALRNAAPDTLAVTDLCVILSNKNETPPHTFFKIDKNLNRAMVGSDVFLCYKKSMAKSNFIVYKPAILGRYPLEDHINTPLPEKVPMFCLPLGASLESWPAKSQRPSPQFSTFVLTMEAWEKLYGASISFYEDVPIDQLTVQQKEQLELSAKSHCSESEGQVANQEHTVHVSKAICVLSRWPFFDTFKRYLSFVNQMSVTGPHDVPLERVISHFLHEVPFPSPQRPRILVQFATTAISLSQPEESPLPQSGASFMTLLKNLSPDNCIMLLLLTLLENKILLHSLRHVVLTSVAEAVANMIFPFHWQCPYIPLCPLELSGVLSAPTPFLVGMDSRYFDLFDPPPDVVCIDLDANTITLPEDKKNLSAKLLPKKATKILRGTLEKLCEYLRHEQFNSEYETGVSLQDALANIDYEFNRKRKENIVESRIQEAFLRFMATILRGYNAHLLPIVQAPTRKATDISSLFDCQGFIKSRDKANHKFFSAMLQTQLFSRFIEERSFVSDKDVSLVFFDDCTEKVSDYSDEPKLLELEGSENSERTVFIPPPDASGLPAETTYTYVGFPELKPELFLQKPSMSNPQVSKLKNGQPPNSPMTKRTKQEIRSAQRIAQKQQAVPSLWAKCLLSNCYSLWFIQLPSFTKCTHSKNKSLRTAYDVLLQMQSAKLEPPDELCYRILLQLCGVYNQPVLAVKVLFEMRNTGVQPNAITYGYYNKAVLESKWPSSDTNAYQLWNKVRHVIQAIAQFKQALKCRRYSVYSASEESAESSDRISRTSTDSFLDDLAPGSHGAPIHGQAYERQDTLRSGGVESPNDERISTGGLSDKGYSSMTLDDNKRSSLIIGSQDSLDSLSKLKGGNIVSPQENKAQLRRKGHRKTGSSASHQDAIDAKTDSDFQEKIGSIVRKSTGSVGSNSTLRSSACSTAGLLMTSECSLEESVFSSTASPSQKNQGQTIRKSLSPPSSPPTSHISADTKPVVLENRSNCSPSSGKMHLDSKEEALENELANSDTSKTLTDTETVTMSAGNKTRYSCSNQEEKQGSEMDNPCVPHEMEKGGCSAIMTERGAGDADSMNDKNNVSLLISENKNNISLEAPCSENSKDVKNTAEENVPNAADSKIKEDNAVSEVQCPVAVNYGLEADPVFANNDSSELLPQSLPHSSTVPVRKTSTDRLSQASSGSAKSLTSPAHSIRTPVTENDPLGVFDTNSSIVTSSSTDASDGQVKSKVKGSNAVSKTRLFGSDGNFKHPLEPFGGTSTPKRSLFSDDSGYKDTSQASSARPLSSSDNNLLDSTSDSTVSQDRTRSSTLPTGTTAPTGGRSGFGRNEGFMRSMRSVASGWLSNKFTQIKETAVGTPAAKESVSDFLVGVMKSPAVKSMKKGLVSMKDTLVESWAIEDGSEDSDEYYRAEYEDDECGHTPTGSAPPHSVLDEYLPGSEDSGSGCQYGSIQSLQTAFFNIAIEVEMCSLSRCVSCSALLYDEEIMAGWSSDDSNLNTSCQFCNSKVVPKLQIYVKDMRECLEPQVVRASRSLESMQTAQSLPGAASKQRGISGYAANLRSQLQAAPFHASESDLPAPLPSNNISNGTPTHTSTLSPADHQFGMSPSPRRAPKAAGNVSRSAEDLLDNSICDVVDDTPVPRTGRVSRTSTVKALEIHQRSPNTSGASSLEASPAHRPLPGQISMGATPPDGGTVEMEGQEEDTHVVIEDATHVEEKTNNKLGIVLEPISVPYLSPLVLRKELETVVGQEGDLCLSKAEFVDEHPIIYWNLLWYFKRIDVTSHLPGLILTAKCTNQHLKTPSLVWAKADSRHVQIRAVWDNLQVQDCEIGKPMYITYFQGPAHSDTVNALISEAQVFSKATLQHVVSSIMYNEVLKPIRMLMNERRKQKHLTSTNKARFRSMYREMLFLAFNVLGRDNIDHDAFDREFRLAYSSLTKQELNRLRTSDKPPSRATICCRKIFDQLEL